MVNYSVCLALLGLGLAACGKEVPTSSPVTTVSGMTITQTVGCSKSSGSNYFQYQVVYYASGEKWVSCEVDTASNNNFESVMYLTGQTGTATETCLVTGDIDAATGGFWQFKNTSGSRASTYSDPASASNGMVISFASTDCHTNFP